MFKNKSLAEHVDSIVIFGAGKHGKMTKEVLAHFGVKVACFCDNNYKNFEKKINETPVFTLDSVKSNFSKAFFIISVIDPHDSEAIRLQLIENGFNKYLYLKDFCDALQETSQNPLIEQYINLIRSYKEPPLIQLSDLQTLTQYLNGDLMHTGLRLNCDVKSFNESRLDYLCSVCKDQTVLHVGACDHSDYIETKLKNNEWLHERLTAVSKNVWGVDINDEAVEICHNLGYKNINCLNTIDDCDEILNWIKSENNNEKCDIMLLGEILEHIDNPVSFLNNIMKKYKNTVSEIMITVPNVFSSQILYYAFQGIECINTDHRYWFTPYSITKIINCAGLKLNEIVLVDCKYNEKLSGIYNNISPLVAATTLVCRAQL